MVGEFAALLPETEFIGFTANERFITCDRLDGFPVFSFENLATHCPPANYSMYVALEYARQSADRQRLRNEAATAGYHMASIVHPSAVISRSAKIGAHCLIGESVVVQAFAEIGDNVSLNARAFLGESARLGDNVYLGAGVIVERQAQVGDHVTIRSGTIIAEGRKVGADTTLAAHSVIANDLPPGTLTHPFLTGLGRIVDKRRPG